MTREATLARQLLRTGRAAGRGSLDGRIRFVALLCATVALALALAAMAATWATYQSRETRGAARSPLLNAAEGGVQSPSLLWKETGDHVRDRQFSVIFIEPLVDGAPLPPGVERWPGPGEALISPALLAEGDDEGITTRYGKLVGEIGPEGLADPGERLAYVRPADGTLDGDSAYRIHGFGSPSAWALGDVASVKSLSVFLSLLIAMLLLPAGLLAVVAARLGAVGRDRRVALIGALGGSRWQVSLLGLGEAAAPILLGTTLIGSLVMAAFLTDIRVPWTGYLLAAADLREHALVLVAAVIAAPLIVALAVVLLHPPAVSGRSTRPQGRPRSRAVKALACLCPLCLLVLSWYPAAAARSGATPELTLVLVGGSVGTLATLPAVAALLISAAGRGVTALGRRRGAPGTLLAGRWTQGRPGYLTRLVAGVVVAVGLLCVVQVYPSVNDSFVRGAREARAQLGLSMLMVDIPQGVPPARTEQWVRALPVGTQTIAYGTTMSGERPDGADGSGTGTEVRMDVVVRGQCPALAALGLACPGSVGAGYITDPNTAAPALRRLVSDSGTDRISVERGSPIGEAGQLVVFNQDGEDLPLRDLKRTAYAGIGPLATVEPLGQSWIGGAQLLSDQLRWIPLLGTLGVLLVAFAATMNNLAEVMRFTRAIAPVSVLAGSRRVYASVAAWTLMAPLCVAAAIGVIGGVWITLPLTTPPRTGVLPGSTLALVSGALVTLAGVMALCAARGAVRESDRWRPHHD
ncbi:MULTISPECIES: ABC transporter permease family protein [Streptomyces]|uniref:FtsX-like permease family protein n=1 Tax=Streptomyces fradiae ATCC 10745 = DSM 40063 TaxID=1319510 RepID=A0A1Y2NP29_STRFR|nr:MULTISPECIES: hypothetical protein [Streptomyces]KAF0650306.1 hypothetical protein K701_09125 [Streptomyces fradiae ATCC 10745 = DSM 40063]OSY49226.1 hypothetical protein BG846_05127 [Streptomyces fradiae ATCC 10745 = DSM 40063]QEV12368.1 hypothetical protein CP974_10375 [Streptomyces fradiae ATCC 10745 = DSM 40063]